MSLKKIAELTGVSPSTVSRVLNNPNYRCNDKDLRDKIWKAAMEMDYAPNEAARNLKKGDETYKKTYYVNILMVDRGGPLADPFSSELLRIIESEIYKKLCILANIWDEPILSNDRKCRTENLDRLVSGLYDSCEGKADGLIVVGRCNGDAFKSLGKYFKNIVSVNRSAAAYHVDEVFCNGYKTAAMAVEHLIENGHADIGYVGPCHNEARYNGFLECMKKHGLEVEPDFIIETARSEKDGYEAMKRYLVMEDMPTAIYASNDIIAIGMIKCLNRHKNLYFRPAVISNDDIEQAQFTDPMLTTVGVPKEELGRLAVELLADRIRHGHSSIVSVELQGKLIKRESCTSVEDTCFNYCI